MKKLKYDVVVAGGGISGVMAALAAAREGAKTLLVERYAALGGMATLGLVQPMTTWGLNETYVVGGTGKKILEDLARHFPGSATPMNPYGPVADAEYLKYRLETVLQEHGVNLLYHNWITDVDGGDQRIHALIAISKSGEIHIDGNVFIDATGDADVAAFAGVPSWVGSQGITLMFIVSGIDEAKMPPRSEIDHIWRENNTVTYAGVAIFKHPRPGTYYFNATEVDQCDGLNSGALTDATLRCRKQAWEIHEIFKKKIPGFANSYIEQTAPALGVRETRHIQGVYTLTGEDVDAGRDFPDTIARAACPVDVHGNEYQGKKVYYRLKKSYGIPYRALISSKIKNLIVTGRPISSDHRAHSSHRRMGPGFALGEAAGLAAAIALKHDNNFHAIDVKNLQQRLMEYGAILAAEK